MEELTDEQKRIYVSILDIEKEEGSTRRRTEAINKLYSTVSNLDKFSKMLDNLFKWYNSR